VFRFLYILLTFVIFNIGIAPSHDALADTGLPLPRFVSLASDEVNVRTGPGKRYPISWVFVRRGYPVEIFEEFEHWRRIRDISGETGWVHKSLLSGRRTILITGEDRPLFEDANSESVVTLIAEPGVLGKLLECDGTWCKLEIAGLAGWIPAVHFYGVFENEKIR
jgi:SH3-like domain-containing protein